MYLISVFKFESERERAQRWDSKKRRECIIIWEKVTKTVNEQILWLVITRQKRIAQWELLSKDNRI